MVLHFKIIFLCTCRVEEIHHKKRRAQFTVIHKTAEKNVISYKTSLRCLYVNRALQCISLLKTRDEEGTRKRDLKVQTCFRAFRDLVFFTVNRQYRELKLISLCS